MPTTCERCLKQPATLACGSLSLCAECAGRALQARKKVKKNKKERDGEQDRPVLIGAAALRALDNEVFCTYYRTQLAPLLALKVERNVTFANATSCDGCPSCTCMDVFLPKKTPALL